MRKMRDSRILMIWSAYLVLLGLLLLSVAACAPLPPPLPPLPVPSKVVTQDGLEYSVLGLKLPGTRQELILKDGEAKTWVPLSLVQFLFFTGPERDRYRPAEVILTTGDKLRGEIFVGQILEGTTDVGYWNLPFNRVERLARGSD
jgi:hypothetical protein